MSSPVETAPEGEEARERIFLNRGKTIFITLRDPLCRNLDFALTLILINLIF